MATIERKSEPISKDADILGNRYTFYSTDAGKFVPQVSVNPGCESLLRQFTYQNDEPLDEFEHIGSMSQLWKTELNDYKLKDFKIVRRSLTQLEDFPIHDFKLGDLLKATAPRLSQREKKKYDPFNEIHNSANYY
jgi:hypothetical protein